MRSRPLHRAPLRLARRCLPLAGLLALLAPVSTAGAATLHVVRGGGFGHGIGMSQYGASGFAAHGRDYRQILAHYYRGTTLSDARGETVRVLLQSGQAEASFQGATRVPGRRLDPSRTYTARPAGPSQVELRTAGGRLVERFDAPLRVTSAAGWVRLAGASINGVSGGSYRGALELRPSSSGGLMTVNAAGLDDYVQGVVPGEMPASWPVEALKAQAVAARSYALATDAGGEAFDQYPDTRSQVYRGMSGEQPSTNAAVQATAGQVLRHRGEIAVTYFFSTSGGRTENVENVFYGAEPKRYLVSVRDPYDGASPRHRWRFTFTTTQMQARLAGLVKGSFRRIGVTQRGTSPRVVWADVVGSGGTTRVRGATLQARLGLHDTWALFTTIGTEARRQSRTASWLARLVPRHELRGGVAPRPLRGLIAVERLTARGWRAARRARTTGGGAFRVPVRAAGLYRVRAGDATGPAVRVR